MIEYLKLHAYNTYSRVHIHIRCHRYGGIKITILFSYMDVNVCMLLTYMMHTNVSMDALIAKQILCLFSIEISMTPSERRPM